MLTKILGNSALPTVNAETASHVPASNTACIITIAAVPNKRHVLCRVVWSYAAAPTAGRLTITGEGTTFDIDITAAGPGSLPLTYVTLPNTDLVVTLAAAAVQGKLNIEYYSES